MADEPESQDRRTPHPVKDIVLPLAVVVALITNALMIGVAWGRLGQRLDTLDSGQREQREALKDLGETDQAIKDRLRDLERDASEDRKDFQLLEDYTRGRIDRLPYHAPPARR